MRIPKTWVPLLTKKIIDNLISKNLVRPGISAEKLLLAAETLILTELTVEDRLNDEVREILKSHASEIEKERMDYRTLFDLTKRKIVKERNIVL